VPAPFAANPFPSRALAAFGPFPYDSMALVIGVNPRTRRLAFNPRPDPRAYLASSVRLVRDDDEATTLMRERHDFHDVALVEQPLPLPAQAPPIDGHAAITHFEPERISIAVESSAPALLVLAEPWFPGWSARVNGSVAPCIPANAWMRAVLVPAGKSQVEMTFHSTYLVPGAVISLVALALIVLLLFRRRAAPTT
jgi:Predicted membrane protein